MTVDELEARMTQRELMGWLVIAKEEADANRKHAAEMDAKSRRKGR